MEDDNKNTEEDDDPNNLTESTHSLQAEADRHNCSNQPPTQGWPQHMQRPPYHDPVFQYMTLLFGDKDPEAVFTFMMGDDADDVLCFLMEQMSAKHGLKLLGTAREDAIIKELEQLVYRKVMEGQNANDLTTEQKGGFTLSHVPKTKAVWLDEGLWMC